MIICGLDISKTHYALVIKDTETKAVDYILCTTAKPIIKKAVKDEIIVHELKAWQSFKKEIESQEAYNLYLCSAIYNYLLEDLVTIPELKGTMAIEGYAIHGSGQVLQIAEIAGLAKTIFYNAYWKIRILAPRSVKLWATGNGSAEKNEILEKAIEEKLYIPDYIIKTDTAYDISDAYFLMRMVETELKIRKDPLYMKKLTEQQKVVFNRVTKANPNNILSTPFIWKKTEKEIKL